jgi:hypothetical protein
MPATTGSPTANSASPSSGFLGIEKRLGNAAERLQHADNVNALYLPRLDAFRYWVLTGDHNAATATYDEALRLELRFEPSSGPLNTVREQVCRLS